MGSQLHCGPYRLDLDRPLVMGILNVTPDSFSDGGRFYAPQSAIDHGRKLIEEGADILDIGGESSRPGADPVSEDEEIKRVLPVIEALADAGVPLSIDTVKPGVMRRAVSSGATLINDICALQEPQALEAAAGSNAAVVLMHMQGEPRTMQAAPHYANVVGEVKSFLAERACAALAAGISRERIVLDPGFGFGKRVEHNLSLLKRLRELEVLGFPILVGLSRKSTLGLVTGRSVSERLPAGLAAGLIAIQNGARIVRVHDVAATRDAVAMWSAVTNFTGA